MEYIFTGIFIGIMIALIISALTFDHDYCYYESMKNGRADENGCDGCFGGDEYTDYLMYTCVDCPHFKNHIKGEKENEIK